MPELVALGIPIGSTICDAHKSDVPRPSTNEKKKMPPPKTKRQKIIHQPKSYSTELAASEAIYADLKKLTSNEGAAILGQVHGYVVGGLQNLMKPITNQIVACLQYTKSMRQRLNTEFKSTLSVLAEASCLHEDGLVLLRETLAENKKLRLEKARLTKRALKADGQLEEASRIILKQRNEMREHENDSADEDEYFPTNTSCAAPGKP